MAYKKIKLPDGTTKDRHRLVMEKYLGRRLNRNEVVHHRDGDITNDDINNLEVQFLSEHSRMHMLKLYREHPERRDVSPSPEARDKLRELFKGSRSSTAKLSEENVKEIKRRLSFGDTLTKIAGDYSVSRRTILRIKQKETWKHV